VSDMAAGTCLPPVPKNMAMLSDISCHEGSETDKIICGIRYFSSRPALTESSMPIESFFFWGGEGDDCSLGVEDGDHVLDVNAD